MPVVAVAVIQMLMLLVTCLPTAVTFQLTSLTVVDIGLLVQMVN